MHEFAVPNWVCIYEILLQAGRIPTLFTRGEFKSRPSTHPFLLAYLRRGPELSPLKAENSFSCFPRLCDTHKYFLTSNISKIDAGKKMRKLWECWAETKLSVRMSYPRNNSRNSNNIAIGKNYSLPFMNSTSCNVLFRERKLQSKRVDKMFKNSIQVLTDEFLSANCIY